MINFYIFSPLLPNSLMFFLSVRLSVFLSNFLLSSFFIFFFRLIYRSNLFPYKWASFFLLPFELNYTSRITSKQNENILRGQFIYWGRGGEESESTTNSFQSVKDFFAREKREKEIRKKVWHCNPGQTLVCG